MFSASSSKRWGISRLSPVRILAIGFLALILAGTFLLMLPHSAASGKTTAFIDALFTSTSAVCVTGLVVYDTGTYWSLFGQMVIIVLTQIGGLGFMTFAALITVALGKKVSMKDKLIMQEAYNTYNMQGLVRLTLYVIGITFSLEALGAVLLATQFVPEFGWSRGIYFGIFHSISAFCNAGFDLMGEYRSITMYATNFVVVLTIGILVMIGSLGFAVIAEIINHKKKQRLTLNAKVVVIAQLVLTVGGALVFFAIEYTNMKTIGGMDLEHKALTSFFNAVIPRSVGFSSVAISDMTTAGTFFTIILMFIGGAPGSTGGGIKTTTAAVIMFAVVAALRGKEDTEVFGKRLSRDLVSRAFIITTVSLVFLIAATMLLSLTEDAAFLVILYEATSAFGTVGLSLGLTPELTTAGKVIVSFGMYVGRLGPMTFALSLAQKNRNRNVSVRYPEEKIIIG